MNTDQLFSAPPETEPPVKTSLTMADWSAIMRRVKSHGMLAADADDGAVAGFIKETLDTQIQPSHGVIAVVRHHVCRKGEAK